ncbi:MAG: hypothetical protein O7157_02155 [Wolbachia endosymbiont of Tetragnatha montana]|nr:hypothetical protein [Wolbachia endosymbiont of Tetragnatha montana]
MPKHTSVRTLQFAGNLRGRFQSGIQLLCCIVHNQFQCQLLG